MKLCKHINLQWPLGIAPQVNAQIKEYHQSVKAKYPRGVSLARVSLPLLVDLLI